MLLSLLLCGTISHAQERVRCREGVTSLNSFNEGRDTEYLITNEVSAAGEVSGRLLLKPGFHVKGSDDYVNMRPVQAKLKSNHWGNPSYLALDFNVAPDPSTEVIDVEMYWYDEYDFFLRWNGQFAVLLCTGCNQNDYTQTTENDGSITFTSTEPWDIVPSSARFVGRTIVQTNDGDCPVFSNVIRDNFDGFQWFQARFADDVHTSVELPDESLVIFPNPLLTSNTNLNVKYTSTEQKHGVVQIIDAKGKVVRSFVSYLKKGSSFISLGDLKLSSGIYFVHLDGNSKRLVVK